MYKHALPNMLAHTLHTHKKRASKMDPLAMALVDKSNDLNSVS